MVEEQAQVVDIKGDQLVLQAQTKSACGSCSANKGCGTSVLSKVVGRKFTHFQAKNDVDANIGDTVIVGISEDALLKGSTMIYIVPVLMMLFFALMAEYLITPVHNHDLIVAVCALSGLAVGSLLARGYFHRRSRTQMYSPVVLRKIIEHGKL